MSEQGRPFVFVWEDAVFEDRELSSKARLVLVALRRYAALDGSSCFPSISRLVKDSSLSRNSVKRGLYEAKERGFISIQERRRGKESTSNLYRLKLPSSPPVHTGPTPVHTGPTPPVHTGPTPVHTGPRSTTGSTSKKKTPVPASSKRARASLGKTQSQAVKEFLVLWNQLLGAHKLNPAVLQGASYEELSTALAWTLWGYKRGLNDHERIKNVPGYFVVLLEACKRGEKQLGAYSRQDLIEVLTQECPPNKARR